MFRYVDGLMSQLEEIEKSPLESKEIQRHIEQQLTPEYAGKVIDEQGKTPVWNLKACVPSLPEMRKLPALQ